MVPEGTVAYIDPPYINTTSYSCTLPRADVLDVVRRWADAGAVVCVSEAEPLALPGWHHVQIDHARVGSPRTFSRQQTEWLTLSAPPSYRPPRQEPLFASPAA